MVSLCDGEFILSNHGVNAICHRCFAFLFFKEPKVLNSKAVI